ncbi:MAG: hypothetical protein OXF68_10840 [Gammaproteobacteria bacterium]|nr:hypothetical protein [Gammaproteobacteria bacterium]
MARLIRFRHVTANHNETKAFVAHKAAHGADRVNAGTIETGLGLVG